MAQPFWTLAILVLAGFTPAAQQPEPPPTFRSGVDLVRFDVRVVDASGRPITDLRPDEIEVYDAGKRLPIVLFQRVTEPAGAYVDAAIRAVTAEVSSNEAFPRGHLYILIFDQQHITPGNEQRARMAAEQFLRTRVRPSDRVALYALPGPGPQLGFTADKTRAIQELTAIRGSFARTVASPLGTMTLYEAHRIVEGDEQLTLKVMARMTAQAGADVIGAVGGGAASAAASEEPGVARRLIIENARTIVNQSDSDSRQFLQRLADVIAGFRDVDGRKTVIFFSEGFFQDNLTRELETVAAAAAQSYCVFYSFDLNQRGPALNEPYVSDTTLATEIQARIAPMSTLAVETDGQLVVDASGRSDRVLDALADQAQDYYLIGFAPPAEASADRGKYRRVSIKVTRPGAQTSARTGYALPAQSVVADRRRSINNVLGAPFVHQGLKLDYTTYVLKAPEPGQHRVVLSLNADLPVRATPADAADVVFVARDVRDGRVVASGTGTIPLPAETREGAGVGTGTWRVQFNVPAGSYLMRTVVREPGGLAGSADRRVDVRPLEGPDVTVSDLVLGSALGALPVRPRAYADDGLSGVIEAYGRSAVQMKGLEVSIELRRENEQTPVASFDADLSDQDEDAAGITQRARFLLPLANIAPGQYIAHATIRARGEVVAERTRQIEVLEGRAPVQTQAAAAASELVSPAEIIQGDLARKYIAWLARRAQGTPAQTAARRAAENRWEHVELELRRAGGDEGVAALALGGLALFVREDYQGAAAALERAFGADPGSAMTAFFLGWAHDGAGDTRAALSAWRGAAHLDPSLVPAHLALADAYLKLSQPALAVQALRAGLAAIPDSPELRERLARIEMSAVRQPPDAEAVMR
ncbi:MAG TPA: VWA domain-containing protein [Vicinamibacterales bacterium]|nr:VWA domain-containing protein [Vicinamibacterales bacterium]